MNGSHQRTEKKARFKLVVAWQALVVRGYHSFFEDVAEWIDDQVVLVSPNTFQESGGQSVALSAPSHTAPDNLQLVGTPTLTFHTQAVLYAGMGRLFRRLTQKKDAPLVVLAISEPYAITTLLLWLHAKLWARGKVYFFCYCAQNIVKKFPWPLRFIQQFLLTRVDGVLVLGKGQSDYLTQCQYKGKRINFPLWYDSRMFHPQGRKDKTRIEQILDGALQASHIVDKVVLVFAGSLSPVKGIIDFLDCLELHSEKFRSDFTVLIAGIGPEKQAVLDRLPGLTKLGLTILYLGPLPQEQMPELFRISDILCVPSKTLPHLKEQFGRVIIEAQACGVHVVGSDSGGIPDVLAFRDYIFKEGDIHDMADKILKIKEKISGKKETEPTLLTWNEQFSDHNLAKSLVNQLATAIIS